MGAKNQEGAFPPAVLGGLLAQAYLTSWEVFAGPVPAEARVQLLPDLVVLGGLEEELEWPLPGGQRPGHQPGSSLSPGQTLAPAPFYPGMDPALMKAKSPYGEGS